MTDLILDDIKPKNKGFFRLSKLQKYYLKLMIRIIFYTLVIIFYNINTLILLCILFTLIDIERKIQKKPIKLDKNNRIIL